MKEIKATAPTRQELYWDYKRVVKRLKLAEDVLRSCNYYDVYETFLGLFDELENKTND